MRDLGYVLQDASDDEALSAFDEFVREEVPGAIVKSFGVSGMKYRYVVVIFLSEGLSVADRLASLIQKEAWSRSLCLEVSNSLLLQFAVYPIICACALRVLQHFFA